MKKNTLKLMHWLYAILLFLPLSVSSQEGTKQLSPSTSLLSGLFYNPVANFGSYFDAPDENQIHFEIADYNKERFYFGFNWTEYAGVGGATNSVLNYSSNTTMYFYYRILDSDGVVAAGPTLLPKVASPNAQGQILTFAAAQNGPKIGTLNPNGYLPIVFVPTKNDTYSIEYWRGTSGTNSTPLNTLAVSPFFDFTVAIPTPLNTPTSYQFKPGRVFATKWGLVTTLANASNQYFTDITVKGSPAFFIYTDQQNVLKLSLPDIQPLAYIIGANNYGINDTGNFENDRKSINNVGGFLPLLSGGYDVFLNAPDEALFPSPPKGAAPSFFGTSIITPVNGCGTPPYDINFNVGSYGDYRLIIKGPNPYVDRVLYLYGINAGTATISWDGRDGAGVLIPAATVLNFELTAFSDRFNLPLVDVEKSVGGVAITTIKPVGVNSSNLFWDDSALTSFNTGNQDGNSTGAGTNNSALGSPSPTHKWSETVTGTVYQAYFGNGRTINSWGYLYYQTVTGTSSLLCADVVVSKTVNIATPTIGSNVIFTLTATNNTNGSPANSVVVKDVLPAGFTFVSTGAIPAGTTFNYPNWSIPTLTFGSPRSLTITATVKADTNYTNVASISTLNYETNYNNNAAYIKVIPTPSPPITVTNICPVPDIDVVLPTKGFQLNTVHNGSIPTGATLVWFNNATHTGTALADTFVTTAGTYYSFYYDSVGNCYSPASASVTYIPQDCKCRKTAASGTPAGFAKMGISTQATKPATWPTSIANGFIALESTNKGFVITRTTTASIATPIKGMLIYDTANNCFSLYNGTSWHCIAQTCNE